jgi:hypothetical protein
VAVVAHKSYNIPTLPTTRRVQADLAEVRRVRIVHRCEYFDFQNVAAAAHFALHVATQIQHVAAEYNRVVNSVLKKAHLLDSSASHDNEANAVAD